MKSSLPDPVKDLKLGFAVLAAAALNVKLAWQTGQASAQQFRSQGVTVIEGEKPITDEKKVREVIRQFKAEAIDLLVIQIGTWTADVLAVTIVKELDVPLLMWAAPERLAGKFPDGMLVGLTQIGGTIAKLGKRFKVLYGAPDDKGVLAQINRSLKVVGTAKRLRRARVGLLGHGCPGMSDTTFHEMELRNRIGPEIVHLDLSSFQAAVRNVAAQAAGKVVEKMKTIGRISGATRADMLSSARVYLGLRNLVEEHDLSGIGVKCWPELKGLGIVSPCFALSQLSNDGVMAGCEGDLTATVSMLILSWLTGRPACLGDLLALDEKENTFSGFHCGAAAFSLADEQAGVELRTHSELARVTWKPGVTVEFPLRPGRVTFARIGEIAGVYRLIIMTGEAVRADMFVRGNVFKIRMDAGVTDLLQRLIAAGAEHHQIFTYGDIKDQLLELCQLLNISAVAL